MNKLYNRTYWENYPSDTSPVNKRNLNNIEVGVDELDNRVITLDTTKADKTTVATMVKDVSYNEDNGIFTVTYLNGATYFLDTKLEKLAVNFSYDASAQQLIITLDDGTIQNVDLSALITQYEFLNTDTVAFSIDSTGKVSALVKDGSITEDKLQPNYLADIKVEVSKAELSVTSAAASEKNASNYSNLAKSYAIGTNGEVRENDVTDNAKYYYEQSKEMVDTVIDNCERPRGIFTGNVDELKGASAVGSYWVHTTAATGTHPVSDSYYLLEVTASTDGIIVQRANMFDDCKIYERMYVNARWYDWNNISFAKFMEKPIFIYIDDDGVSTFKTIYENILQPRNIKGGLSVITDTIDGGDFTYLTQDEILNFQSNGWTILNHSCDGETITKDNAETKISYAIQRFQALGYDSKYNIFVYPNGNISDDSSDVINYVKDYFDFAINTQGSTTNIPIIGIENKFSIGRVFINQGMDDEAKAWIKTLVDETISNNKLMIISTHSYNCDEEYLEEVLDYIINKGGEFYSPDEAFDYICGSLEQTACNAVDETYYGKFKVLEDKDGFLQKQIDNISIDISAHTVNEWECADININTETPGLYVFETLAASEDTLVASASDNGIYYSKDTGKNWTKGSDIIMNASPIRLKHITYGGGKFVGISSYGGTFYSETGESWTHSGNIELPGTVRKIFYENGMFFATGSNVIYRSQDGIKNWEGGGCTGEVGALAYGNGIYVAAAMRQSITNLQTYHSTDGINWTLGGTVPDNATIPRLAYGAGKFVITERKGVYYSLDNGATWNKALETSKVARDIVYTEDGTFILTEDEGGIYCSEDGITWAKTREIEENLYSTLTMFGLACSNGNIIAAGSHLTNENVTLTRIYRGEITKDRKTAEIIVNNLHKKIKSIEGQIASLGQRINNIETTISLHTTQISDIYSILEDEGLIPVEEDTGLKG